MSLLPLKLAHLDWHSVQLVFNVLLSQPLELIIIKRIQINIILKSMHHFYYSTLFM